MLHELNSPFVSVQIQTTMVISILFSASQIFHAVKCQKSQE